MSECVCVSAFSHAGSCCEGTAFHPEIVAVLLPRESSKVVLFGFFALFE